MHCSNYHFVSGKTLKVQWRRSYIVRIYLQSVRLYLWNVEMTLKQHSVLTYLWRLYFFRLCFVGHFYCHFFRFFAFPTFIDAPNVVKEGKTVTDDTYLLNRSKW